MSVSRVLKRTVRPLASRKVRVALATVVGAYAAEYGLGLSEELVLTILSVGKLVNVFAGSGGVILVMAGHEKDVALRVGLAALLNVVLNALLIPRYGIEGAAFATATCEILMSLSIALALYRRLQIHSTALGSLRPDVGRAPGT